MLPELRQGVKANSIMATIQVFDREFPFSEEQGEVLASFFIAFGGNDDNKLGRESALAGDETPPSM